MRDDDYIHFVFQVTQHNNCDVGQEGAEVILLNSDGNKVAGSTQTNEYGEVDWRADWPEGYYIVKAWYPPRPNYNQCLTKLVYYNGTDFWDSACLEECNIEH